MTSSMSETYPGKETLAYVLHESPFASISMSAGATPLWSLWSHVTAVTPWCLLLQYSYSFLHQTVPLNINVSLKLGWIKIYICRQFHRPLLYPFKKGMDG